jgi:hypothetical protein
MKKEYPPLEVLRKEHGVNKTIPPAYEEVILKVLSHYPELKDVHITFKLADKHPIPYSTMPALKTVFREGKKRKYIISILEEADLPVRQALFKNLPAEAQMAVIAHELGHVLQFIDHSPAKLVKTAFMNSNVYDRRDLKREADLHAIKHGLGFELYVHSMFIRKIPGYVQLRKEIDTDYLKPQEILDTLPEGTAV